MSNTSIINSIVDTGNSNFSLYNNNNSNINQTFNNTFVTGGINLNDYDSRTQCHFEQPPLTEVRIWIVTVFGTIVSLVSIVENSFFFYLFSTRFVVVITFVVNLVFLGNITVQPTICI